MVLLQMLNERQHLVQHFDYKCSIKYLQWSPLSFFNSISKYEIYLPPKIYLVMNVQNPVYSYYLGENHMISLCYD